MVVDLDLLLQKHTYHYDDAVQVKNLELVSRICKLLDVKEEAFLEALTSKRTIAGGETMVVRYKLEDVSCHPLDLTKIIASLDVNTFIIGAHGCSFSGNISGTRYLVFNYITCLRLIICVFAYAC